LELLDEDQLGDLLEEQARINFDVGELLVLKGVLSARQMEEERRAFLEQKQHNT
jgi:hypothetical protein